jgi:hypothetical protein
VKRKQGYIQLLYSCHDNGTESDHGKRSLHCCPTDQAKPGISVRKTVATIPIADGLKNVCDQLKIYLNDSYKCSHQTDVPVINFQQ